MKKYSKIFSLALLTLGLSSCLKDDMIDDQKYGMINLDANKVVEIHSDVSSSAVPIEDKTVTVDFLTVNLAANDPATEDLKITLAVDPETQDLIDAYNDDNGTEFQLFPTDKYTLPEGLTVTIPKGSRTGSLKINLNSTQLDPAHPYAIAFKIASAPSGYVISGNYNSTLATIAAKNQYDGIYTVTNLYFKNTLGAAHVANSPRTRYLETVSGNQNVSFDPASGYYISFLNGTAPSIYGNFNPVFTFDLATGNVIAATNYYPPNTQGRTVALDPTGVNKITITGDSKVMEVSYFMVTNGVQNLSIKERWEYKGPRP